MKKEILIADNIDNIYDEINALIREKKTNVKKVVNDAIISLNWGIGKRLRTISGNPRQFNYRDESAGVCISAQCK